MVRGITSRYCFRAAWSWLGLQRGMLCFSENFFAIALVVSRLPWELCRLHGRHSLSASTCQLVAEGWQNWELQCKLERQPACLQSKSFVPYGYNQRISKGATFTLEANCLPLVSKVCTCLDKMVFSMQTMKVATQLFFFLIYIFKFKYLGKQVPKELVQISLEKRLEKINCMCLFLISRVIESCIFWCQEKCQWRFTSKVGR